MGTKASQSGKPGVRLNRRHSDMVRQKIRGVHLVKLLQDHADGRIELSDGRRDSAKFLISYALSKPVQQVQQDGELVIRWQK